ncbi:hypothetical protein [Thiothrix winogradskyi]|uniref:Lipoprotein n=1 Tax=Thiothrix winogradskyi TaxID=96472 RepID=A0ABY3SVB9_9GAMM|nr:hypothetical protein [Thiothrix winogradskyi]UJS23350.1 hypothetical protein L2Y54_15560 [Thiothrix winogradskyi]
MTHPSRLTTLASTTLLLSSLTLLSACGGGSSTPATGDTGDTSPIVTTPVTPDTSLKTGVFIDAPVKGLTYKTATQSGVTNDKGEFNYITGETVTFSLDGVELGSAKAQAKLPITLISTEVYIAQFLQTMDTDPNPDLIDVSKIKLSATVKTDLAALIAKDGDCHRVKCLETILDTATLTQIQTDSQVALVNQAMVTEEAAAKHVYNAVGSTPWETSEISGTVMAEEGEQTLDLTLFNSDGTFTIMNHFDNEDLVQSVGTWQLNSGQLLVSFTEDGNSNQFKLHKISQDGDTIDVFAENTTDTTNGDLIEFHKAKPLTLAALNGKHISFDMTGNTHCSAMTISFSGTTATLRDKCGGKYDEGTVPVEEVAGTKNLIKLNGGDGYMLLALASGDLTKGRMIRAGFDGSTLEDLQANGITTVSEPLKP